LYLALPANIRLGWKGMPGTNNLAYYKNKYITAVKKIIISSIGVTLHIVASLMINIYNRNMFIAQASGGRKWLLIYGRELNTGKIMHFCSNLS
jgi:hypothetical protein